LNITKIYIGLKKEDIMEDVKKQFLAIFNGVGLSILTVWLVNTIGEVTTYFINGIN
jgi:hypothetical protein